MEISLIEVTLRSFSGYGTTENAACLLEVQILLYICIYYGLYITMSADKSAVLTPSHFSEMI